MFVDLLVPFGPWSFRHHGPCQGNYCQKAEGKFAKGPGVMANPGGATGCAKGGKCMFKFAKCTKCGQGELGVKAGSCVTAAWYMLLVCH